MGDRSYRCNETLETPKRTTRDPLALRPVAHIRTTHGRFTTGPREDRPPALFATMISFLRAPPTQPTFTTGHTAGTDQETSPC